VSDGSAFFVEADALRAGAQVGQSQAQRTTTAAARFQVEADEQRVQGRVISAGAGHSVQLGYFVVCEPSAWSRLAARFWHGQGRVICNEAVVYGTPEQEPAGAYGVFTGGTAVASVATPQSVLFYDCDPGEQVTGADFSQGPGGQG